MTLIVSLRIPDGIVIAGDSLSTVVGQGQLEATIDVNCPSCGHNHEIQSQFPVPQLPSTTFSYAQKVFPFCNNFGIGIFGSGLVGDQSVYFAIRLIEKNIKDLTTKGVTEIANDIGNEIHDILAQQMEANNININDLPDGEMILGFHMVGYDNTHPKTVEAFIGKSLTIKVHEGLGCTYSGSGDMVQAIWQLYRNNPGSQAAYPVFSLQEINYAEFLIGATIAHQQFSATMPNVGGHIDVALVTPFDGFEWIRQKSFGGLSEIFGGRSK